MPFETLSDWWATARHRWRAFTTASIADDAGAVLDRPVFIVGCGRSGTTILGRLLEQHPQLAYLNEPRRIWKLDPRTNVWERPARWGRRHLAMTEQDVRPDVQAQIARAFAAEVREQNATRLVEKLPINSFRIAYLAAMFPGALFVHLLRNGLEVARSIERVRDSLAWFGRDDYKWTLLAEYARQQGLGSLAELAGNEPVLRGLLEWRLSVMSCLNAQHRLPAARWLELRYEDLLADPVAACIALEQFIDVEPDPAMRDFAASQVQRRTAPVDVTAITPAIERIAGDLLRQLGYLQANHNGEG